MEKRILIIDNDRATVAPLKAEMERQGYFVMVVEDGETGLRQIAESMPDLLIVEVDLPDIDGFEIVKTIRTNEQIQELALRYGLPIIMLSTRQDDETVFRYFNSGADCYLIKPVILIEIMSFIKRIFQVQTEGD